MADVGVCWRVPGSWSRSGASSTVGVGRLVFPARRAGTGATGHISSRGSDDHPRERLSGIIAPIIWERKLKPYQRQRLLVFLDPVPATREPLRYHVIQSQVAIGSGGWLGKGFTMGTQKRLAFLPPSTPISSSPLVGEELGFIGVAVALTLFLVLFMRSDPRSQRVPTTRSAVSWRSAWRPVGSCTSGKTSA